MRELTHNILIESPLPATRRGLWVYGRAAVSAASKPFMLGDLALQTNSRYDAAD